MPRINQFDILIQAMNKSFISHRNNDVLSSYYSIYLILFTMSFFIGCSKKNDPTPATNTSCVVYKTSNSQNKGQDIQYEYNDNGKIRKQLVYDNGVLKYTSIYLYKTSNKIVIKNINSSESIVFTYNSSNKLISYINFSGPDASGDTINDAYFYSYATNGIDIVQKVKNWYITNNKLKTKKVITFSDFSNGKPAIANTINYNYDTITKQSQISTQYLDKLSYLDGLLISDSSYSIVNGAFNYTTRAVFTYDYSTSNPQILVLEQGINLNFPFGPENSPFLLDYSVVYDKNNKVISRKEMVTSKKTTSGLPFSYAEVYIYLRNTEPVSTTILFDFEYQNCGN